MRVRLHEPWLPGAVFHAVGALSMRLRVRPADAAWEVWWSECPLSAEAQGVTEVICWRALQLPRGHRVRDCEPEPDHRFADGALLTWSMVVPKGEHLNLRVVCVAQG